MYFSLFVGLLGIIVCFTYFRVNEKYFCKDRLIGKAMQYIGKRTLDIYLLHYFFLPSELPFLKGIITNDSSATVCLFTTFTIALAVVAVCLLTSSVLRLSPFVAKWVFGVDYDR